jgi:nitroimidazol reductase NimA-like FMN-containing flavoprotein (pyridoxamine 5'-phosphate oxidase superfamily)
MPFDHGLARLTRDECMTLLESASFGRVGVSVEALPAILPVTISMLDGSVVFRTIPGTKLAQAAAGSILAVEADDYDAAAGDGWSVLVRGVASELIDDRDIARARRLLADSWIDGETAEHYVQVSCDLVTGRRLRHTTSTDAWPDAWPDPG